MKEGRKPSFMQRAELRIVPMPMKLLFSAPCKLIVGESFVEPLDLLLFVRGNPIERRAACARCFAWRLPKWRRKAFSKPSHEVILSGG